MRRTNRALSGSLEQRRARDRRRRGLTAMVGLVLVAGSAFALRQVADVKSPYAIDNAAGADGNDKKPLGRPPEVPEGVGTFSFTAEQATSDEPVTFDPCRTIPWAVHDELAPPGSDAIVEDAVREIAEATGLVFVRRDAGPDADYHSVTVKDGRSPVIIDWTTPREVRSLLGSTAGVGGSAFLSDASGERHYVTGAVALDTPYFRRVLATPKGAVVARAIIMHELGHVVGLDHVDDRNELMFGGKGLPRHDLGPGDREGLALLGAGRCAL